MEDHYNNHSEVVPLPKQENVTAMRKNLAKALFRDMGQDENKMKRLIKEFDWSKTEIGPLEEAPISLMSSLSMMLSSKFPMVTTFLFHFFLLIFKSLYIDIILG